MWEWGVCVCRLRRRVCLKTATHQVFVGSAVLVLKVISVKATAAPRTSSIDCSGGRPI